MNYTDNVVSDVLGISELTLSNVSEVIKKV